MNEIHDIESRPPKRVTMDEIGMPINPAKHLNFTKPLLTILAPITGSVIVAITRKEISFGKAVRVRDVIVTMSDGAKTALDVYLPKKVFKNRLKCPTVLVRTPYWKDDLGPLLGNVITQHGFVLVMQDIRGTGHSNKTGVSSFMMFEREDALDIIAWIKKQFWYNGKIGTWGPSYLGMTQWCVYDNEDITCFNPQISSPRNMWSQHNGLDTIEINVNLSRIQCDAIWFYDNVLDKKKEKMRYWRYTQNFLENPAATMFYAYLGEPELSMSMLESMNKAEIVEKMREMFGMDLGAKSVKPRDYQRFMMKLMWDPKVQFLHEYMTSNVGMDWKKINRPFLILAGWYDMFIKINMKDFQSIMTYGGDVARKYTKMVIGPWAHGEIRHPDIKNPYNGGIFNLIKEFANLDWFKYWLQDDTNKKKSKYEYWPKRKKFEREFIKKPPLLIFTIGKNKWRYEKTWPLTNTKYTPIYLHSSGNANTRFGDGYLDFKAPDTEEQPDKYDFDPANPVITRGGNNLIIPKGAFEQEPTEKRHDVLVYTSDKLEFGIEITGDLKMILHASSSACDTDFMVKLCDVYPNGKSYNISDLGIRAIYRNGILNKPKLLKPNKIYKFEFELFPTSYYVKKGHRLRIDVTSSDFPKYNVNSNMGNTGKPGNYKIARQKIYHDKEHPSCLILPIIH
ncbi:MAG: CocE/NonD family hydrolase [Promethearchaeota archaeon]